MPAKYTKSSQKSSDNSNVKKRATLWKLIEEADAETD